MIDGSGATFPRQSQRRDTKSSYFMLLAVGHAGHTTTARLDDCDASLLS